MKEQLITEILYSMQGHINNDGLQELKKVLYVKLHNFNMVEVTTELAIRERNYQYYLNLFLARKKSEGKSDNTIEQYRTLLRLLLEYMNKDVAEINEDDLFCYLIIYKKERNVSNGYLDHMRLVFSSFFSWLNSKGYISKNPTLGLEPIKSEKKIKKPLSEEELEILRCSCRRERDLALIEFLYSTGVRVSELAALDRKDIDFLGKEVIVFGKGAKERETYLNVKSCMHLKAYLESRMDNNEALFVSAKAPHSRLTVAGIENILKKLGNSVGIKKVHPHRFRRTMATNALKKGMPIEEVKELLGHNKLDTTMIYCTVSRDNVKHSHKKYIA